MPYAQNQAFTSNLWWNQTDANQSFAVATNYSGNTTQANTPLTGLVLKGSTNPTDPYDKGRFQVYFKGIRAGQSETVVQNTAVMATQTPEIEWMPAGNYSLTFNGVRRTAAIGGNLTALSGNNSIVQDVSAVALELSHPLPYSYIAINVVRPDGTSKMVSGRAGQIFASASASFDLSSAIGADGNHTVQVWHYAPIYTSSNPIAVSSSPANAPATPPFGNQQAGLWQPLGLVTPNQHYYGWAMLGSMPVNIQGRMSISGATIITTE
jgi:hypothetical protein